MSKKNNVYITTPPVEVIWTHIHQPDEGRTHNGRPISDGMYKVTAVLDPNIPRERDLLKTVKETNILHFKLAGLPDATIYPVLKQQVGDDGNNTGKWLLTAKSKFPVDLVDAHNEPIPSDTYVGWHSVCNIKLALRPTSYQTTMAGSTINLNGMRILKLVQLDDYGDPVEEGFSGENLRMKARQRTVDPAASIAPPRNDYDDAQDAFDSAAAEAREYSDGRHYAPAEDDELPF